MFWVGLVCFLMGISTLYGAWVPIRRAFLDKPKSPQETLEIQKYKDMYDADRNLFWTHAGIVSGLGFALFLFGMYGWGVFGEPLSLVDRFTGNWGKTQ